MSPMPWLLSTVGPDGCPASRTVLLKFFDEEGFRFLHQLQQCQGEGDRGGSPELRYSIPWLALGAAGKRIEGSSGKSGHGRVSEVLCLPSARESDRGLGVGPVFVWWIHGPCCSIKWLS